jgi:hypothetical protein
MTAREWLADYCLGFACGTGICLWKMYSGPRSTRSPLAKPAKPCIACKTCGIKTVQGPWARQGSGFTLFFEAFVLILCKQMPVLWVANLIGEYDTRLRPP